MHTRLYDLELSCDIILKITPSGLAFVVFAICRQF